MFYPPIISEIHSSPSETATTDTTEEAAAEEETAETARQNFLLDLHVANDVETLLVAKYASSHFGALTNMCLHARER